MRNILQILLLISLISCQSNNGVNGIWVGPYRSSPFHNQATIYEPYIISFKNGDFKAKGLYFEDDLGKYSYSATAFEFNNEGVMKITSKLNVDSLAFEGTKEDPFSIIFRKIPDSLKSEGSDKINLYGKKFTFDGIKKSDTLYFINDSILSYSSKKNGTFYKRIFFEGIDIIFVSDSRTPPLIIREIVDNKIKITAYPKELKNIKLTEI